MQIDLTKLGVGPAPVSTNVVPNLFPKFIPPKRIAIVGDYPKTSEATHPFEATHGGVLASFCRANKVDLDSCFQGNVLNYHPGKFSMFRFDWKDPRCQASCARLRKDLEVFKPDIIIGLGEIALHFFKNTPGEFDDERGAPFKDVHTKTLTVCTYHPRQIFIQYKLRVIAEADLAKSFDYVASGFNIDALPPLDIQYETPYANILGILDGFTKRRAYLLVDIETTFSAPQRLTCIGLSPTPFSCLVIPFMNKGTPAWEPWQEANILRKLAECLETCRLCGHNAVHFDHLVLAQQYKINANFIDDTMLAQWECYQEMPKSLGFINSLYSNNPFWKNDLKAARSGRVPYWQEFLYNGRDCCYNLQAGLELAKEIKSLGPRPRLHYKFNIRVSKCFQYASLRGVVLDKTKAAKRQTELQVEVDVFNEELTKEVGHELNVGSSKQMNDFLYRELKLPTQYKRVKDQDGEMENRETSNFLSLLYLARQFPDIRALQLAAECRKRRKRLSWLTNLIPDENGRVYFGFNVVGAKTGRGAGYKPLNGYGCQPQNVPRTDRDLFLAGDNVLGEECFWLKADLEGADSWTQATQLAAIGSTVLFEDLKVGLKPALVITIAEHFGEHLLNAPREELLMYVKRTKDIIKQEEKTKGKGQTSYDVNKVVSHGSAYMMKGPMMHTNIFTRTQGELFVPVKECERRQQMIFVRYPFPKLHDVMRGIMNSRGFLETADGAKRTFYGRKDDATVREMLAHAPQAHTTFTSNVVLERWFYNDAYFIQGHRIPVMEPLNQVHDETDSAFAIARLDDAREIFHKTKDVELEFWGEKFTIPFEAQYGETWGTANEEM